MIRHLYWSDPKPSVALRSQTKPHTGRRASRIVWRIAKLAVPSRHRGKNQSKFKLLIRELRAPFIDPEWTKDDKRKRRNKQKALRRHRRGER